MSDVFKVHIDDPNPAEIEELTLIISEGPQVIAVDGMIIGRKWYPLPRHSDRDPRAKCASVFITDEAGAVWSLQNAVMYAQFSTMKVLFVTVIFVCEDIKRGPRGQA
jgi:hypothetical protein